MADLLDQLPAGFRSVRYNGAAPPDGSHDLTAGANCQRFAYAVLAEFGRLLPPWWSSELWEDNALTVAVAEFEPLDLLLFGRDQEPYGAHIGVYAGDGDVLHLAKSVGVPAVWRLDAFAARPEYRVLIGGKRVRR